jgi:hypothetical protein
MANYDELFPDEPQEPFAPIRTGRVNQQLTDIRSRVRTAIPTTGDINQGSGSFLDAFGDLMTTPPSSPQSNGETEWKDYGKSAVAGVGDLGQAGAGGVEYFANRYKGAESTPFEQSMGDLAGAARGGRQASQNFSQDWFASMTPEAQARAVREITNLDPNKTIWQGGPGEFLSSVGLKLSRSAPSTAVTLLPGALMMRAGLGAGSIAYLGASEGALSLGSIAANIAQEVEQAPEQELMQSPRYKELRSTMDEQAARQQLTIEAQGNAPLIGGLIVGAISAAAGRYLEPVFVDAGKGALSRFGRGYASEAFQEAGQSSAEQVAQNAAAQLYDKDRSLTEGVGEQALQGGMVGGLMGGGMAATLGGGHQTQSPLGGEPVTSPEQPIPEGPPTSSFQDVFGDVAPREPTQFDAEGQGLIDTSPIDPAIQQAMNIRRETKMDDMFEPQGMTPQAEQQSYMQNPWPVAQQGMDLPQASTAMVPTQGEPVQPPLGLRDRQRGAPPTIVEPMAAQPMQQDLSPPEGFAGAPTQEAGTPGRTRADFLRNRASLMQTAPTFADENQQDMFTPPNNQMADEPSAEPIGDLLAQLEDLRDPDSNRLGVYLSGANIDQLRADGTFEAVRGVGVPLANFDGKGGTLIAKDRPTAEHLIALRNEGGDMQQVLGLATGAGIGKPAGADIAVQQRDEQGNVVQESLVATPEEADALAASFEAPGREGVVLSAGMAIKRRAQKIAQESAAAQQQQAGKKLYRKASDLIDTTVTDPLRQEELRDIARAATTGKTEADRLRAKAQMAREAQTTQARREAQSFEARQKLDTYTEKQIEGLDDEDLEPVFREAAAVASGSKVKRRSDDARPMGEGRNELFVPDKAGRAASDEGATNVVVVHGRTVEEIIEAHKTRSEKLKFIERVQRMQQRREHGGRSKTKPITATTEQRGEKGEKAPVRKAEFKPTQLFDIAPPREMSVADTVVHNEKVKQTYADLAKTLQKFNERMGQLGNKFEAEWRQREGNGNQPQSARDAFYAGVYMNTLMRYGQLMEQMHPRSNKGLKEVQRFIKIVDDLSALPNDKFTQKLVRLTEAEIDEQGNIVARVDPNVLGFVSDKTKRRAKALKSVAKLEERVKWAKRLHDVWHNDSKYEQFIAPLMQKLIGYVTHDSSLGNIAVERRGLGYTPTFNEMRNLRYALQTFKKTDNEQLYKPLKRWFSDFGYKFDDKGDLVLARNAKEFEYEQPSELLKQDRTAFLNHPQNYVQKMRAAAAQRLDKMLSGERRRRAELTEAQRIREDRTLANRIERDRRSTMSYAQRTALEALDRQTKPLGLELLSLTSDAPGVRLAAEAISSLLEENQSGFVPLTDLLKLASSKIAADHAYQPILQRLIALNMADATVTWDRSGKFVTGIADYRQVGSSERVIRVNRPKLESYRATGQDPSFGFMHAIIHEAVHAATVGAIRNNFTYGRAINVLIRHIKAQAEARGISTLDPALGRNLEEFYGLMGKNEEFIAEAFSNERFQKFLKSIDFEPKKSVWRYMIDLIKRFLGMADTPEVTNALDLVLSTTDKLFTGELTRPTAGHGDALNIEDQFAQGHVGNLIDKVMQSNRVTKEVRTRAANMLEMNKEGGSRFLLSALTMEQIRDFYNKSFGGSGGPLSEYMKAFFKRNADNSANMETADKLSRRWTALTEEHGAEQAVELSRIMSEGTLYGIHPNEPLASTANATVTSVPQKQRYADLSKRFKAMNSDFKSLYSDAQQYYDETFKREVALVALNAIRASTGSNNFNYVERDVERLKLNTVKGLEKEFGDQLNDSERKLISRIAALPQNRIGPYFPLMRFGDYVVTAERVKERKTFSDAGAARTWAQEQRENDPTLSVSSPIESGGSFTVTVTEKEVRMAETPSEAEQNRADMLAEYGSGTVSQVQLKAQLYTRGATIESGSGLKTILNKLDGNPAAQAAIKDFYLRSLSDGAFRKREIKRANRRGVNYDTQHRTFASYAKSAAYYTSQLRFGWQMADSLIDMQKYVEETAKGTHTADISPIRMGEVVREINTRDKLTTEPLEVSKLVRGGTELSQFMMLTSPSYWMINLTQPWMVTMPWLSARSSPGEASAALANAQKLIASPIVNQMVESGGGLKALWSKAGAEKAFTVLEQVEKHIAQRGGHRSHEYIAMLNKLKRESIIDLSFVAELRDIAEGQNTSLTQRVLDASRIMSHLSEVNNRILTAIAAFDLYRNKGASIEESEDFAKQAVSLTQFNYSAGNAPRLFTARGPLGQMGPLVFQFMKYPQHMYALLIDNMRRAVYSGGMDRQIALKTLAGLFATHLAAGGIIGAMLQPVKWAIGLALAAFGDDDEPYTLKNALSGETFDRMIRSATAELFGTDAGEIISAGLPRAAGVDLSSRMSLGSLYFVNLNTESADTLLGTMVQSFGGPSVNLMSGFYKGMQYMGEGQVSKGVEAFLPKGAKDIAKAIRYSNDGLTDATGKEIMGAKDMSPWELFAQSIGFAPSSVAEKYAARAAIKDAQSYDDDRRAKLIRRFQNASVDERAGIISEITSFNRANPAASISRSQLLKSMQSFRQREARVKTYGLDLRGADVAYAEEGEPYETD